jgi:hypothetical protein
MNNQEKEFYELHEDRIKDHVDLNDNGEDTIDDIYESDLNFKHADRTTGMRCYDRYEIGHLLRASIRYLQKEGDRCSHCARKIADEDLIQVDEPREYHGETVMETVSIGYDCSLCGHQERV